uniref:NADH dehydrogenase subunit 6 n=1 Tax=Acerentomon microrhinus TaxID=996308 RepID=A0A0C4FSS8_9HEXA|nr:NADH dehydrogenase subunit 6 [Acerentomon microrhinus]AFI54923.1 NADH dehydrogenase subunit 6 [Acerentomon microrhinus]
MMFFCLSFIFIYSPLLMLILVILSSLNFCWANLLINSWVSYYLFLIFVAGMMIIFAYVTSLLKDKPSKVKMSWSLSIFLFSVIFFEKLNLGKVEFSGGHLFNAEYLSGMGFIMIYLLVILILVVSIIFFNKSPMRVS